MREGSAPSVLHISLFALASRLLTRLPLARLERVLTGGAPTAVDVALLSETERRLERALGATHRFARHTCYTRGITRYYFLHRAGARPRLVFGMQPNGDGHCWIVRDGEPYREPEDPRHVFVQTYVIPSDG